jgi:hypothetical protein
MKEFFFAALRDPYSNYDPRRRQEQKDMRMISEDPYSISNCPQRAIHKQFNPDYFTDEAKKVWNEYNDK